MPPTSYGACPVIRRWPTASTSSWAGEGGIVEGAGHDRVEERGGRRHITTPGVADAVGRDAPVAPGELQIAVAHCYLLQDQVVGALDSSGVPGLTAESFTDDYPLRLRSPVELPSLKGATPYIERMAVYVEEGGTIRIPMFIRVQHAAFEA